MNGGAGQEGHGAAGSSGWLPTRNVRASEAVLGAEKKCHRVQLWGGGFASEVFCSKLQGPRKVGGGRRLRGNAPAPQAKPSSRPLPGMEDQAHLEDLAVPPPSLSVCWRGILPARQEGEGGRWGLGGGDELWSPLILRVPSYGVLERRLDWGAKLPGMGVTGGGWSSRDCFGQRFVCVGVSAQPLDGSRYEFGKGGGRRCRGRPGGGTFRRLPESQDWVWGGGERRSAAWMVEASPTYPQPGSPSGRR